MKVLKHEQLVIGSTLSALVYSYYTGFPILYTRVREPFRFDWFSADFDLDSIVDKPATRTLKTLDSFIEVGLEKRKMWSFLFFTLSLSGMILFGDKVNSIRVDGNRLRAITKRTKEIDFDKLIIFDDHELYGVGREALQDNKYFVYDWINVKSGSNHEFDIFEYPDDDIVKKIIFYETDRINGRHNLKDAVVISELTQEQISDYRFSDTYIRFRAEKDMKSAGIRGTRNGRDQRNPERFKYYALNLEVAERQVDKIGFSTIVEASNASLDTRSAEAIIESFRNTKPSGYLRKASKCIARNILI